MDNRELLNKLREIDTEDFIWFIYLGIIFLSWYSNGLERKYFLENDKKSKEMYRHIIIFIFSVLVLVYLYFVKDSYEGVNSLKQSDSFKKKELTVLSFISSLLIAISGFIFLYIAISDNDIDVEVAFN